MPVRLQPLPRRNRDVTGAPVPVQPHDSGARVETAELVCAKSRRGSGSSRLRDRPQQPRTTHSSINQESSNTQVVTVIASGGIGEAIARSQGSIKTVLLADLNKPAPWSAIRRATYDA